MPISIDPVENGEAGLSVRQKINLLIEGARDGSIGAVTPEDLENIIDRTPPAVPTGLTVTSTSEPAIMTIAWDFNSETDFAYYDIHVMESGGNWVGYQTSAEMLPLSVRPNITYDVKIRAVDQVGNMSAFSAVVSHTTARDTIPPAAPIGLVVRGGLESIWLSWLANTESDLSHYELYESASDVTPLPSAAASHMTVANNFVRAGLDMETTLNFWVRAVDTSGNKSPWSARVEETTGKIRGEIKVALVGVTFKPAQGVDKNTLEWTSGSIIYGVAGDVPSEQALPAGDVTWTSATMYICYVPGRAQIDIYTSLTLMYADDAIILGIYKGGHDFQLVEGKAFMDGGLILAQTIGANQLVTNAAVITGTAQIADAVIEDAHIVDLDAAKLQAGTTLTGSITVDEQYTLDNPAAGVNLGTTLINPGKVLISGATTLASWKNGPDSTEINGDAIAAGTLSVNKGVFGLRGITVEGLQFEANLPVTNSVAWTAGTIKYIGDDGNIASFNVSAGSVAWTVGVRYIYYVKGSSALASTTTPADAFQDDRIILAVYRGGIDLVTDYGRTVIDGAHLKTGTVVADSARVGSIDTDALAAGAVTTNALAAGAVKADNMDVNTLSAIVADLGLVVAGRMENATGSMVIDLDNSFISIKVP